MMHIRGPLLDALKPLFINQSSKGEVRTKLILELDEKVDEEKYEEIQRYLDKCLNDILAMVRTG